MFVKKTLAERDLTRVGLFPFFAQMGWERLRFCLKKIRSGQRKEKDLNKEKKRTRTKKVFCRPKTYASRIISSCARLHARSGSVQKILSIKRTKKSDKKNKKASCRRRIREQVGLFPSFIEFHLCIWKKASCRRKRAYTRKQDYFLHYSIQMRCPDKILHLFTGTPWDLWYETNTEAAKH